MTPVDRFRRAWEALARRLGLGDGPSAVALDDLLMRYGGDGRHYHGVEHVARMLDVIEAHAGRFREPGAVRLAAFFHDAVYDPSRDDYEERSASLLFERLGGEASPSTLERSRSMILATRRHEASGDAEIDLFSDIDLSILAAPWPDYARYAEGVRREYAPAFGDASYRRGRLGFLRSVLARGRIFLTAEYAPQDSAALANLAHEVDALEADGELPGVR